MKAQKIITVCLAILFTLLLLVTVTFTALSAVCAPRAVERRLERNGFYTLAVDSIQTEIGHLESVIGIPTADILKTVPDETVKNLLKPYVLTTAEQLLRGGDAPVSVDFQSDALYTLVCSVITEEQYDGDTAQMAEDRAAAYADLKAAVDDTLSFFPATLFDTAMNILASKQRVNTLYATVRLVRKLVLPAILLTLLCGGALLVYRKKDRIPTLKLLGGCWSITGCVLFFASLFTLAGNHLLDKFSLSDGLLRRFVVALFQNAAVGIITVTAVCFALGVAVLAVAIVKTTCVAKETVIE